MKELIVSLLVLVSTGMVFGQESNNNGFTAPSGMRNGLGALKKSDPPLVPIEGSLRSRSSAARFGATDPNSNVGSSTRAFNSPTSDNSGRFGANRSVLNSELSDDRRGFSSGSKPDFSSSSSQNASNTTKPFYLPIGDRESSLLKRQGYIVAGPLYDQQTNKLVQTFERIVFSDKGEAENGKYTKAIQPTRFNDGRIVFQLNDREIQGLQDRTLYFDVPSDYANSIKEIAVEYEDFQPQNNNSITQRDTLGQRPFGTQPRRKWTANDRNGLNNNAGAGNVQDRWNLPNSADRTGVARNPVETQAERDQRLAWEKNQRDLDARQQWLQQKENDLRLEAIRQQQELDRLKAMQIAANQPQPSFQNQIRPDRLAYNGNGIIPGMSVTPNPVQNNGGDIKAVELLAEQLKQANDRVAQLAGENQYLHNQRNASPAFTQVKTDISDQVRDRFGNTLPKPDYYGDSLARKEPAPSATSSGRPMLNTGGNNGGNDMFQKNKIGSIDNTADDEDRQDKGQLMMLILLLISFSLNLYLWWLAQSFYSRYKELADELRETFTATA